MSLKGFNHDLPPKIKTIANQTMQDISSLNIKHSKNEKTFDLKKRRKLIKSIKPMLNLQNLNF